MRGWKTIGALTLFGALVSAAAGKAVAQDLPPRPLLEPSPQPNLSRLKVCLRLQDETPFPGAAEVQVLPDEGYELEATGWEHSGEWVFAGVAPGKYIVEVSAPGFLAVRQRAEIKAENGDLTLLVVMKPRARPIEAASPVSAGSRVKAGPEPNENPPHEGTGEALRVDASVACPTEKILKGVGERMQEFVGTLEKFTATESVTHFSVDRSGEKKKPDHREFAYVVVVTHATGGMFLVEEYRNGSTDPGQFPGNIATMGLPAMALLFHPDFSDGFAFQCEGLARRNGRELWQVHFVQRDDRPAKIETYSVEGKSFPVSLEGRAWIDPGTTQVVRLESDLAKPIPQIELVKQHQEIEYTAMKFASTDQEIWLPQNAEVSVERHGRRYFRIHAFRDFRLFNVDTAQNVQAPKSSYRVTNLTDRDMTCELTVSPAEGSSARPVTLRFSLPPHKTVIKAVGPGKEVNLPVESVRAAKLVHSGESGSVRVDVNVSNETTLDVVPASEAERPL